MVHKSMKHFCRQNKKLHKRGVFIRNEVLRVAKAVFMQHVWYLNPSVGSKVMSCCLAL